MEKTITHIFAIFLLTISTSLLAQEHKPVKELVDGLTTIEKERLLDLIISKNGVDKSLAAENLVLLLAKESESSAQDFIELARNKAYQVPAEVTFSADTIDFGRVKIGTILRDTVVFEVHGAATYGPQNYLSSCPHLSMSLPEYPVTPGQTGELPIKLETRQFVDGPLRLLLSVRGNNGPNHRHLIYVKAELYSTPDYTLKRP